MSTQPHDMNAGSSSAANHSDIIILNQEIDEEDGVYRIQQGGAVGYLTIPVDVFDEDTMCRPYLLIPEIGPVLPQQPWTEAKLSRKACDGSLKLTFTNHPLRAIENTWHRQFIDVLTLARGERYRSNVHEVIYEGQPAVAKIAMFDWDVSRIANETWVYSLLEEDQRDHPSEPRIAPAFLGHLTENGRVMGMLLEKLDGTRASIEHLKDCRGAIQRFHKMGLIHGDVNRHNFVVQQESGNVKLVDFEHAEGFNETNATLEIESLVSELNETTGRGAKTVRIVA